MATDEEKLEAVVEQLGNMVRNKIRAYASVQEASADNNVSLTILRNIQDKRMAKVPFTSLVHVAESMGIQVVFGDETNDDTTV